MKKIFLGSSATPLLLLAVIFSISTATRVNATEACGSKTGLDMLECLQLDAGVVTNYCKQISSVYKKNFECRPLIDDGDIANFESISDLDTYVSYAAFSDYFLKSSDKAVAFGSTFTADKVGVKAELKKRYYAFAKAYGCKKPKMKKGYDSSISAITSDTSFVNKVCYPNSSYSTKAEAMQAVEEGFISDLKTNGFGVTKPSGQLNKAGYFSKFKSWLKNRGKQGFYADMVFARCSEEVARLSNEFACPPLMIDSNYFAGNQSSISKTLLDESITTNANAIACIKKKAVEKRKLSRINAWGSASTLDNTGYGLCAKGFMDLSNRRAKAAVNKIKQELGKDPLNINTTDARVVIDYEGTNGDGTSGPCAYQVTSEGELGTTLLKSLETLRKLLKPYQYVKVQVVFENEASKSQTSTTGATCCEVYRPSRDITFTCDDVYTGDVPSSVVSDWVL